MGYFPYHPYGSKGVIGGFIFRNRMKGISLLLVLTMLLTSLAGCGQQSVVNEGKTEGVSSVAATVNTSAADTSVQKETSTT